MTQVLVPASNGTPIQFVPEGLPSGFWPSLIISRVPPGSKLLGKIVAVLGGPKYSWDPPDKPRFYELAADAAGLWSFEYLGSNNQMVTLSLEIAAGFKRTITSNGHSATLLIHVGDDAVQTGPALTPVRDDAIATRAVRASGVTSALTALVGMSATQLSSTGMPNLEAAWTTACANPPSLQGESSATGALLAGGWERAWP